MSCYVYNSTSLLYMSNNYLHNPCYVHLSTTYISYVIYLFIFSFWLRSKKRKWTKREKHAKDFCAACGIALTEWTYVLFASLTKSFRFCYRAYAHAKLLSVTHLSESGERARSAIVSPERIWAESSNNILALSVSEMQGTFACFLFLRFTSFSLPRK